MIVLLIRPEDIIDSTPPLVANEVVISTLKGDHNHACTLARESIVKEQMKQKHQFDKKVSKNRCVFFIFRNVI